MNHYHRLAQPTHVTGWLIQLFFVIGLKFRDRIQNPAPLVILVTTLNGKTLIMSITVPLQILQISSVEILWFNHPPPALLAYFVEYVQSRMHTKH